MAESLDDGEFWLPPQFLTDDVLFSDKKSTDDKKVPGGVVVGGGGAMDVFASEATEFSKDIFPLEFPYGFDTYSGVSSDLSSPVESVVGSAEESDEDELLTCRLARSNKATFGNENKKGWAVSGSPQSTLCGVGSDCRCRKLSSNGSPNECSPPATWDLLHAAAGEVARIRMDEEGCVLNRHSRGVLGPPQRKASPVAAVYLKNSNPDLGFLQQQSIAYQKLQASQFHQMRQQQMMKQQGTDAATVAWGGQNKGAATALFPQQQQAQSVQARVRNMGRPVGLNPSVWPPIQHAQAQHQHRQVGGGGSGMRAMFLGGNNRGAKRECAGTGVFLPRQIGTPTESRKKTASTAVLLPAKVVQALKLEDGGHPPAQIQQRLNGTFHPSRENGVRSRNCNVQKRNLIIRPQQETEVRLPQEWTY